MGLLFFVSKMRTPFFISMLQPYDNHGTHLLEKKLNSNVILFEPYDRCQCENLYGLKL